MFKINNVGVGVLAWNAPETLSNTLRAFTSELPGNCFQDALVFCQEVSDVDVKIVQEYGFRVAGNTSNEGIFNGIKQVVSNVDAEVVLFLECDCLLIEDAETAARIIQTSADLLLSRELDVVRLRERKHYRSQNCKNQNNKFKKYWPLAGQPDTTLQVIRRLLRPFKAREMVGRSCISLDSPEQVFPKQISKSESGFFVIKSNYLNWSNQSVMFRKDWFMEEIIPYAESNLSKRGVNGFPDLEKELNCKWWRTKAFNIGWADPGLFTHHRLDRPKLDEKNA